MEIVQTIINVVQQEAHEMLSVQCLFEMCYNPHIGVIIAYIFSIEYFHKLN